jgi:hypothetical protein
VTLLGELLSGNSLFYKKKRDLLQISQ